MLIFPSDSLQTNRLSLVSVKCNHPSSTQPKIARGLHPINDAALSVETISAFWQWGQDILVGCLKTKNGSILIVISECMFISTPLLLKLNLPIRQKIFRLYEFLLNRLLSKTNLAFWLFRDYRAALD